MKAMHDCRRPAGCIVGYKFLVHLGVSFLERVPFLWLQRKTTILGGSNLKKRPTHSSQGDQVKSVTLMCPWHGFHGPRRTARPRTLSFFSKTGSVSPGFLMVSCKEIRIPEKNGEGTPRTTTVRFFTRDEQRVFNPRHTHRVTWLWVTQNETLVNGTMD